MLLIDWWHTYNGSYLNSIKSINNNPYCTCRCITLSTFIHQTYIGFSRFSFNLCNVITNDYVRLSMSSLSARLDYIQLHRWIKLSERLVAIFLSLLIHLSDWISGVNWPAKLERVVNQEWLYQKPALCGPIFSSPPVNYYCKWARKHGIKNSGNMSASTLLDREQIVYIIKRRGRTVSGLVTRSFVKMLRRTG